MNLNPLRLAMAMLTGFVLLAFAVAGSRGGQQRFGAEAPSFILFPPRVLERIGMDKAQIGNAQQMHEKHRATIEPLLQRGKEIRANLKEELNREKPSALQVGELVIAGHGLRQRIGETRRSFWKSFEAILTPEQLDKLTKFRQRRGERRGFQRGFRGGPPSKDF